MSWHRIIRRIDYGHGSVWWFWAIDILGYSCAIITAQVFVFINSTFFLPKSSRQKAQLFRSQICVGKCLRYVEPRWLVSFWQMHDFYKTSIGFRKIELPNGQIWDRICRICETECLVFFLKLRTIEQRCKVGKICTRLAEKNLKTVLIEAVSFWLFFHFFFLTNPQWWRYSRGRSLDSGIRKPHP